MIVAKSAIVEKQIRNKASMCPNIELQLLKEFVNEGKNPEELFKVVKAVPEANIVVVHTPIYNSHALNIEEIGDKDTLDLLKKSTELTNLIAEHEGHDVKMIVHTAFDFELLQRAFPSVLKEVEEVVSDIVTNHPRIILCIENTVPISTNGSSKFYYRNGTYDDNIKMVKHLRKVCKTNRICTVLDTCHMMISISFLDRVCENDYPEISFPITPSAYFAKNKEYIGLIHLADVIGLGLNKSEHGIKFTEDRLYKMEQFISLYKQHGYTCDITIEIQEEDYDVSGNFKQNYHDLVHICKEYELTQLLQ